MKIFNYILLAVAMISWSCSTSSEQDSGLDSNESPPTIIKLTNEQLNKAGIRIGKLPTVSILTDIECTGTIDVPPNHRSIIHSMIAANVIDIRVLPGTVVGKGEVLAIMEHPNILDLQLQFVNARAEKEKLDLDLKRKTELYDSKVTSEKEYLEVKTSQAIADANYQSMVKKLGLIGISEDAMNRNGITSRIVIRSTIDGKIGSISINSGQYVEMNQPMFSIINETHIHLELEVFANDALKVEKGQRIIFHTPGLDSWHEGEVELINPEVSESNTVRIHGHISEGESFKIGSFVESKIIVGVNEVVGIRNSEIIRDGDAFYLYKLYPEGFAKRDVKIGISNNEFTEILADPNDSTWVVSGNYYLNGM